MGETDKIDFDKYGHCVLCHKVLIFKQVIDQKVVERYAPDYAEDEFLLDDGSRMRVCMCKNCLNTHTEKDHKKIMKCVIKGWEEEIKVINWSEQRKKDYLDKYTKKYILCNSLNKHKDYLDDVLRKNKVANVNN
jgi:hypothetical protein